MEGYYHIQGYGIYVSFDPGIVHIRNDESLRRLLDRSLGGGTTALVSMIKEEYKSAFGEELKISNDSLTVEIWGHVYFENFIGIVSNVFRLKMVTRLDQLVSEHCDIIDCGETNQDGNRKFWDSLAPHKDLIAQMLRRLHI